MAYDGSFWAFQVASIFVLILILFKAPEYFWVGLLAWGMCTAFIAPFSHTEDKGKASKK